MHELIKIKLKPLNRLSDTAELFKSTPKFSTEILETHFNEELSATIQVLTDKEKEETWKKPNKANTFLNLKL